MAQVLSTFSRLEQSRFEAFRKAAFRGDAVAKYVAHCLIHEQHRPVSVGNHTQANINAATNNTKRTRIPGANSQETVRDGKTKARFRNLRPNSHYQRRVVLSEVVAPGQAQDIALVVSTLAKEYAQRLVLAARRYATERLANDDNEEDPAISPEDLFQAHADRQARGLDPGFFLQTTTQKNTEIPNLLKDPENQQRYSLSRSVALAAQEEYDRDQQEREERQNEEVNINKNNGDDEEDNDNGMNIDSNGDVEMTNTEYAMDANDEEEKLDEEASNDGEEEEEDPSEQAMRLFSLHVNRMIARQNGITIVTSDDEETSVDNKKEEEETKHNTTPSSSKEGEEATNTEHKEEETKSSILAESSSAPASTTIMEEEIAKPPTTSPPLSSAMPNEQEEEKEEANTETKEEETTRVSSMPKAQGEEVVNTIAKTNSESKEIDETVPMDTSVDAVASATTQKLTEGVEVSGGDVVMASNPENNSTKEPPEQAKEVQMQMGPPQEEIVSIPPLESQTDATATVSDPATQEESQTQTQSQEEAAVSSPTKHDASAAINATSSSEEALDATNSDGNELKGAPKEQEIIMIDED